MLHPPRRSLPLDSSPGGGVHSGNLLPYLQILDMCRSDVHQTNTLAYNDTELIMTLQCFIVKVQEEHYAPHP
jgi:hypothetical protein